MPMLGARLDWIRNMGFLMVFLVQCAKSYQQEWLKFSQDAYLANLRDSQNMVYVLFWNPGFSSGEGCTGSVNHIQKKPHLWGPREILQYINSIFQTISFVLYLVDCNVSFLLAYSLDLWHLAISLSCMNQVSWLFCSGLRPNRVLKVSEKGHYSKTDVYVLVYFGSPSVMLCVCLCLHCKALDSAVTDLHRKLRNIHYIFTATKTN